MNVFISKYKLRSALLSSAAISVIILLGQILSLIREPQEHRYYSAVLVIFLACLFDWAMLILRDYIAFHRAFRKIEKVMHLAVYFLLGIGSFLVAVKIGSLLSFRGFGANNLPDNYMYRRILGGFVFSLIIYFIDYSVSLFEERERILLENERLLRENLQAKFETLRQQVNPHFLFNSLSTLKTMMNRNVEEAEEYLLRLSEVFRYSLQINNQEKVLLSEELTVLEAYFFMLKSRFGDNISFDIRIDERHKNLFVPPFTLQIVAENCIKHNIVSSEKPLWIKIDSKTDNRIKISNNLQPKISVEGSSKVGLANIEKRYKYLSGQHIEIEKNTETFDVVIPLISEK